ncbi:MAG: hypothetical protein AB1449_14470, partial [Chloroflexota bacterium]
MNQEVTLTVREQKRLFVITEVLAGGWSVSLAAAKLELSFRQVRRLLAAFALSHPALYPVQWLTANIINALLGTLVWSVAGEVCNARQAKRLFPLFASAGIVGGVAA